MLKKFIFTVVTLVILLFIILLWFATIRVYKKYEIVDEIKAVDYCKVKLNALGILLEVYQKKHFGRYPTDINSLFSDPNVVSTPIFGIQGNSIEGDYQTKEERIRNLFICPGQKESSSALYVYRGKDVSEKDSGLILIYDQIDNHTDVVNILYNAKESRVTTSLKSELKEIFNRDNELRKKYGLTPQPY